MGGEARNRRTTCRHKRDFIGHTNRAFGDPIEFVAFCHIFPPARRCHAWRFGQDLVFDFQQFFLSPGVREAYPTFFALLAGPRPLKVNHRPLAVGDHLAALIPIAIGKIVNHNLVSKGTRFGTVKAIIDTFGENPIVQTDRLKELNRRRIMKRAQAGPAKLQPGKAT